MQRWNMTAGLACLAILAKGVSSPRAETPLERGTYLMSGIVACGNCHTPKGPQGELPGMDLAGGVVFKEDVFTAVSPNITPDAETGIGKWTDAQIVAAIREGKRPDGTIIGPPMPIALYRDMADDDANAIVAYLRSVKPTANKAAKSHYKLPLPPSYGPPIAHVAPDFVNHAGGGGLHFNGPWGVSYAPNITPTGIGKYSDDDVKNAITKGVRPNGSRLMPPMAYGYYRQIAPADLDAMVAYLRTLKPL